MAQYIKTEEGYKSREELDIGHESFDLALRLETAIGKNISEFSFLSSADSAEIISGSFDNVVKALNNGKTPKVLLECSHYVGSYLHYIRTFTAEYHDQYLIFKVESDYANLATSKTCYIRIIGHLDQIGNVIVVVK